MNPLLDVLVRAARGEFPPADSGVDVLAAPPGRADAVVAFTAHHLVAASVDEKEVLAQIPPGNLTVPLAAPFLVWLGRRIGSEPGSLDVVLAAEHETSLRDALVEVTNLDHPRVQRARRYRDDVRVFREARGAGIVTIGRGLAGRWETTFEVAPEHRNRGVGRLLARASRAFVPAGEPLFAQVAPGNAASLRAAIAAGFVPLGAEVLFLRRALASA